MKSYEIKAFSLASAFKFCFICGLVLGLIVSIIVILLGASLEEMGFGFNFNLFQGGVSFGTAVITVFLGALFYGVVSGVCGFISALLYNIFAKIAGGLVVKLTERE